MTRYLKYIDLIIFPILGMYLVYLFTRYSGVGISPDSIVYTSAARSLHTTGSLITYENVPVTNFPVFYPAFLWLELTITGVDPFKAGPVLDQLLFAATIFFSGYVILKFRPTAVLYRWLILAAITLAPAMLEVYTYLWSETLFILITLLFIIAAHYYFIIRTWKALLLFAFVAALSSITRYAGVTLIGTGGLLLLMHRDNLKVKIQHLIVFGFCSCSFLSLNLLRNTSATGHLAGAREGSFTPFMVNVYYFGTVLCDWAGFPANFYSFARLLTFLLFAALIAALIYSYLKRTIGSYGSIILAFTLVYGAFILLSSTFSRYERINSRLLSPMFITLLLSCTYWAIGLLKNLAGVRKKAVAAVFTALMLGFIYCEGFSANVNSPNSIESAYKRFDEEGDYGVPGYTDDSWNKSDFATYLRKDQPSFQPGIPIYSDANEAVYFLSGKKVILLPHRYFSNTVQDFFKVKHYYLIWFNTINNPELISINDITKAEKLKLLKQFSDGAIYEYEGE